MTVWWSYETTADGLPVGDGAGQAFRTICRTVVPVSAGQVVEVRARGRVTNDLGYTVGVGWHLWGYDVDGDTSVWWRLGRSCGDNVTPARHHMPLSTFDVWEVPASWPDGHRLVAVLRGDAHSSAAKPGDVLTVDPLSLVAARAS